MKIHIYHSKTDERGGVFNTDLGDRFVCSVPEVGTELFVDGRLHKVQKVHLIATLDEDDPPFHQIWAAVYVS